MEQSVSLPTTPSSPVGQTGSAIDSLRNRSISLASSTSDDYGLSNLVLADVSLSQGHHSMTSGKRHTVDRAPASGTLAATVSNHVHRPSGPVHHSTPSKSATAHTGSYSPLTIPSPSPRASSNRAQRHVSPSPSHRHSALRDSTTNMQVSSAQSPNGAFVANEDPSSVRLDHSVWSSTDHSGWIEDSILSNIFHPPAAGPPTSPRTGSQSKFWAYLINAL